MDIAILKTIDKIYKVPLPLSVYILYRPRPLYDVPYMFEAREFLRKKLIGKKVSVTVDYVQPPANNFPEKVCSTVTIGGV